MRRLILGLTLILFCGAVAAQQPGPMSAAKPVDKPATPKTAAKKPPPKPKGPPARELFGSATAPAPLRRPLDRLLCQRLPRRRRVAADQRPGLAGDAALAQPQLGHIRALLDYLERLASDARALDGWPGLLVGDMSQPRGGPMLTGHTSHQIGLDADIWLTPMPDRILTPQEREDMIAVSMLKDPFTVDPEIFTLAQVKLIRRAASYPQVARIFVHPAIKKALCQMAPQVGKDTSWLGKVRPWWNHHYHFHIRLTCPPDADGCENQKPANGDNGCGQELTNWYAMLKKSAIEAAKQPVPGAKPWVGKPPLTMAQLPKECGTVLTAGGFEPPPQGEDGTVMPASALQALETKDAGPPIPILTAAQLQALIGGGTDPAGMPLPDRNPLR